MKIYYIGVGAPFIGLGSLLKYKVYFTLSMAPIYSRDAFGP